MKNTIGIVAVACFADIAAPASVATSTAAGSPASSAARAGTRSETALGETVLDRDIRPTTKPARCNPSRNAVRIGVSAIRRAAAEIADHRIAFCARAGRTATRRCRRDAQGRPSGSLDHLVGAPQASIAAR